MDWLRSEDLNEAENVTAPIAIIAVHCTQPFQKGNEAYYLDMSRIHPECSDAESPDRSVAAEALLRQEPSDEEDEEEDERDGKEDEDDDEEEDGYSE
jgi:hypothetical protein